MMSWVYSLIAGAFLLGVLYPAPAPKANVLSVKIEDRTFSHSVILHKGERFVSFGSSNGISFWITRKRHFGEKAETYFAEIQYPNNQYDEVLIKEQ
jgi:hypothetical protein